jgi:type II secretory pathway pseudopilin PulG
MALFALVYLSAAATTALKPSAMAKQAERELEQVSAVRVTALELQQQEREAAEKLNHRVASCPVNIIGQIPDQTDPRYREWLTTQAMASAEDLATQDGFNPGQWYLYTHKGAPLLAIKGTTAGLEIATPENNPDMSVHSVCSLNRLSTPEPGIDKNNGVLTRT